MELWRVSRPLLKYRLIGIYLIKACKPTNIKYNRMPVILVLWSFNLLYTFNRKVFFFFFFKRQVYKRREYQIMESLQIYDNWFVLCIHKNISLDVPWSGTS